LDVSAYRKGNLLKFCSCVSSATFFSRYSKQTNYSIVQENHAGDEYQYSASLEGEYDTSALTSNLKQTIEALLLASGELALGCTPDPVVLLSSNSLRVMEIIH
jgi:hypothetical protein